MFRLCRLMFRLCRLMFRLCRLMFRLCRLMFRDCRLMFRLCRLMFRLCRLIIRLCGLMFSHCNLMFRLCRLMFRLCRLMFRLSRLMFRLCRLMFRLCRLMFRLCRFMFRLCRLWPAWHLWIFGTQADRFRLIKSELKTTTSTRGLSTQNIAQPEFREEENANKMKNSIENDLFRLDIVSILLEWRLFSGQIYIGKFCRSARYATQKTHKKLLLKISEELPWVTTEYYICKLLQADCVFNFIWFCCVNCS